MKKLLLIALAALALHLAPQSAFAITCASDEWCCRHDFSAGGVCVKCCKKTSSENSSGEKLRPGVVRTQSMCTPNGFCWQPGLPRCCSGSCTATPKCPGAQNCLCD